MTRMLEAAQRYAAHGFPVFPCHSVRNGRCTCGQVCGSPGKHPRSPNGFYDATTSAERITAYWTQVQDANIGIPTGPESGILVLDIDDKYDGQNTLGEFEKKYGYLKGPEVITGAGRHFYFRYPAGRDIQSRSAIAPGLDIRAKGGYVVAPPSGHMSGKQYTWAAELNGTTPDQLPDPPTWLITLVTRKNPPQSNVDVAEKIAEGKRNQHLASLAGSMRRRGMTEQAMLAALRVENANRCSTPLPDTEVEAIAHSVARYEPAVNGDPRLHDRAAQAPEEGPSTNINCLWTTAAEIEQMDIGETEWLASGYVAKGAVTEFIGAIKGGKTTLSLAFVKACLHGGEWLSRRVTQTPVVYLTEQPPQSFRAQMRRAGVAGHPDLHVLMYHKIRHLKWELIVKIAAEKAAGVGAQVVIVDTFAKFAGFEGESENSTGAGQAAMSALSVVAAEGLAVLSLRHARKSGGNVSEAGRGSSAISGSADIVVVCQRPEGNQPSTFRELHAISRFGDETPDRVTAELVGDTYVLRGDTSTVRQDDLTARVFDRLPDTSGSAISVSDLMRLCEGGRSGIERALADLMAAGKAAYVGSGKKADPKRFFLSSQKCCSNDVQAEKADFSPTTITTTDTIGSEKKMVSAQTGTLYASSLSTIVKNPPPVPEHELQVSNSQAVLAEDRRHDDEEVWL